MKKKTTTVNEYQIRVVAFIDILGFKNIINKSATNVEEFNRIWKALEELKKFFIRPKNNSQIKIERELDLDTQIIQVSDSLVISRLIHEQGGIYHLLYDCSLATHLLINNGFLCRGAIRSGKMYHNDSTIFGPAFIDAYESESSEKLPIIKFDEDLFKIVKEFPGPANRGYEDWEISFIKKNCKEIMTGIYYLDYFTDYDDRVGGGEGTASLHYVKLRDIIVEGLKVANNSSIYEKYRWAADQFNLTATNFGLEKI